MTKLKFLFIAMTLVIITSCSNDDDTTASTSDDILGTWVGATVTYTATSTTKANGQTYTMESLGTGYDVNYILTFAEPNVLTVEGSYSVALSTTILGQTTTQNFENLEFASDGNWTKSKNELTFLANGQIQNVTITELTANSMTLVTRDTSTKVAEGTTTVIEMVTTYTRR